MAEASASTPSGPIDHGNDDNDNVDPLASLGLFATLDHAQAFHGIPSQDYTQYQQYCTKRLRRVRHHRHVRAYLVHNAKYRTAAEAHAAGRSGTTTSGKLPKHAYCPRPLLPREAPVVVVATTEAETTQEDNDNNNNDDAPPPPLVTRHPYLVEHVLWQAERAWAHACAATTRSGGGSGHRTAQRRLRKAVQWAQHVVDVIDAVRSTTTPHDDNTTTLLAREGQAYLAWMKGNQALEAKDYAAAFGQYGTSRKILLQLVEASSRGDDPQSDIWTTRAETVLQPLIRFCQYEARLDDDHADDTQTPHPAATHKTKKAVGIPLEFRHRVVDLEGQPQQLAVLYLKLQDTLETSPTTTSSSRTTATTTTTTTSTTTDDDDDEAAFFQLLADLDDALGIVAKESARATTAAARADVATLRGYFTYHKLRLQRQHQEATLHMEGGGGGTDDDKEGEADNLFHFYDALLQNAQAVADLTIEEDADEDGPGATPDDGDDDDDYNPEDDPHWLEAQAHVVRIRAYRCYYLARVYHEDTALGSTADVLALLHQARILQRRASEEVAACELDEYLPGLEALGRDLRVWTCRVEATRYLELVGASTGLQQSTNRPLWQRLHDMDAGPVLADDPPVTIPLPCKPVFYDLAGARLSERVDWEPLDDFLEHAAPDPSSSGGGFFGWWFSSSSGR